MIIVEGHYKAENTRLVCHLLERFPNLILAPEPPDFEDAADFIAYLGINLARCPRRTRPVVFDGFPLFTQMAYGLVYGSPYAISTSQIITARERLSNHDPLIVYCWKGPVEMGQSGEGERRLSEILDCYETVLDCLRVGEIVRYDLREASICAALERKVTEYFT